MKVLIVEDNANLADVVRMGLSMEGMEAKAVYDGRDALEELNSGEWNMLILDRDLPGLHGDEIAKRLSERRDPIHILMLTAASQTEDIVRGLDLGADDYLTKPFEYAELLARVNAVRRRLSMVNDMVYNRDDFSADFRTGSITVRGAELKFGKRELAVLRTLIEARLVRNVYIVRFGRMITLIREESSRPQSMRFARKSESLISLKPFPDKDIAYHEKA